MPEIVHIVFSCPACQKELSRENAGRGEARVFGPPEVDCPRCGCQNIHTPWKRWSEGTLREKAWCLSRCLGVTLFFAVLSALPLSLPALWILRATSGFSDLTVVLIMIGLIWSITFGLVVRNLRSDRLYRLHRCLG